MEFDVLLRLKLIANLLLPDLEAQVALVLRLQTLLVFAHDGCTLLQGKEVREHVVADLLAFLLECLHLTLVTIEGLPLHCFLVRVVTHLNFFDPFVLSCG